MASLQHFALRDEALDMIRTVSDKYGLRLIPEVPVLERPHLDVFDHYEPRVGEMLDRFPVLHLEGPFTTHGLHFKQRTSGTAAGSYYIDTAVGPRLTWHLSGCVDEQPKPRVTPGSVGYLMMYRNPDTNEWEPASDALKAAYKSIGATLKRAMERTKLRKDRHVWIGRETKRQIDAGLLARPW